MSHSETLRVLVCGGRDYDDDGELFSVLTALLWEAGYTHGCMMIIHGGAKGADSMAADFAASCSIPVKEYPARWDLWGKRAGLIRNQFMLEDSCPDVVVACDGGTGTADMVRRARAAGVRILRVTRWARSRS